MSIIKQLRKCAWNIIIICWNWDVSNGTNKKSKLQYCTSKWKLIKESEEFDVVKGAHDYMQKHGIEEDNMNCNELQN